MPYADDTIEVFSRIKHTEEYTQTKGTKNSPIRGTDASGAQ